MKLTQTNPYCYTRQGELVAPGRVQECDARHRAGWLRCRICDVEWTAAWPDCVECDTTLECPVCKHRTAEPL